MWKVKLGKKFRYLGVYEAYDVECWFASRGRILEKTCLTLFFYTNITLDVAHLDYLKRRNKLYLTKLLNP